MKKISFILMFVLIGIVAFAQKDPEAKQILDAMSTKMKQIPAYSADITSAMVNEVDNINEEFNGKITVKGDMYKLEMDDQVVINNGSTVWTYLPDVNEVNIDNYTPSEDEISPSKIYEAYKSGYKYMLVSPETSKNGETVAEVDLVPNDKDAQFFKIKLFISQKTKNLKGWTMFDKSGNQYEYTIKNFKTNINPKDSFFAFDTSKYPGVEVIDLR
ncbi:LolA family protein [Fulvivirga sediminis]|uniref:Outer membrane lipoprotein carrier protein LolA n=1 Tax=Fulvivirga sediminis TaxID=2803949 RepID=A0A937F7Z2_9BACT|nr:outer membrane lipoprotein carrier protein LolA [Fulvivirga sediminis]MBL3656692.1 outer membrane lipoprotein carrier protein LolA [Fulvivirga sediminis]